MAGDAHYDHEPARLAMEEGAMLGLHRFCEMVLGEAQREAPIEEGTLRGSGTIIPDGRALLIAFILIYAAYQHEGHRADGSYVIQNHPKGGKIKYLEDPLKAHAHELEAAVAAGVRMMLRQRGL